MRIAILCSVFVCMCLTLSVSGAVELAPDAEYQGEISNPLTTAIDFRAVVTPPYHTGTLRVWVPIPPSDKLQTVKPLGFSTFPMQIEPTIAVEPTYGNRFAYFEFDHPQGAQIIQHRFEVTTHNVHWKVDPNKVALPDAWPTEFAPYLQSDAAVNVNPQVASIASGFTANNGPFGKLTNAMQWLNQHMVYNHSNSSLQASSEHAVIHQQGHCSDYHGLCSAFGRALGFPTRVTYGMATFAKNSPSHCKLEAFLPNYGWVSFDISETQKLLQKIEATDQLSAQEKLKLIAAARQRLYSGFRDNTWFLQTRGTDYALAPPAARKVNVVRTIYAEADGEALPEPDPADQTKREYGWMTSHRYVSDREVPYPFKDWTTLQSKNE